MVDDWELLIDIYSIYNEDGTYEDLTIWEEILDADFCDICWDEENYGSDCYCWYIYLDRLEIQLESGTFDIYGNSSILVESQILEQEWIWGTYIHDYYNEESCSDLEDSSNSYNGCIDYWDNSFDDIDGLKFYFDSSTWALIRPSGTEPIVRIFAESENKSNLNSYWDEVFTAINSFNG